MTEDNFFGRNEQDICIRVWLYCNFARIRSVKCFSNVGVGLKMHYPDRGVRFD